MFIFCLCDVGYWIRVNTVQKVKTKNLLPKYVGSLTAEVRTVYFFQVSSPFRDILRRNSEAITARTDHSKITFFPRILRPLGCDFNRGIVNRGINLFSGTPY